MSDVTRSDEDVTADLLGILREEEPDAPADLPARAIRRVRASITTRDLLDLTTVVFLMRFCAPLLDLVAAMLGADLPNREERDRS